MRPILVVVEFGGLKLVCIVIPDCYSFGMSCRHGVPDIDCTGRGPHMSGSQ